MILNNPVFLTQSRLRWRSTFWPMTIVSCLVALLLFLWVSNSLPENLSEDMLKSEHYNVLMNQWLIIVNIQGFFCSLFMGLVVFQSISKDMQTGMLEHIQLTPLSAHRILWGYLLGPSLSVLASFAAYTIVLLYTTLIYNLELTFFLTSQVVNFIGLMVFGLLAVYIGLLKGKNIISNFIVATLLMGLYFLGYVSEGTNVYSFLSSSFLLKLETYNYFFEYLLEYQQNKMVDPKSMLDIGPFSIGVLWVYIIFSALIIFGSWFYNLSIFRVRKSYWRSEIFLYLVYILIIID